MERCRNRSGTYCADLIEDFNAKSLDNEERDTRGKCSSQLTGGSVQIDCAMGDGPKLESCHRSDSFSAQVRFSIGDRRFPAASPLSDDRFHFQSFGTICTLSILHAIFANESFRSLSVLRHVNQPLLTSRSSVTSRGFVTSSSLRLPPPDQLRRV
jgi:hypothetical protein